MARRSCSPPTIHRRRNSRWLPSWARSSTLMILRTLISWRRRSVIFRRRSAAVTIRADCSRSAMISWTTQAMRNTVWQPSSYLRHSRCWKQKVRNISVSMLSLQAIRLQMSIIRCLRRYYLRWRSSWKKRPAQILNLSTCLVALAFLTARIRSRTISLQSARASARFMRKFWFRLAWAM